MATEVKLPQLGQTMEEGTIVSSNVKVGDEIKKGDVLFEIETDKATLEMESPAEGFVKGIVANEGDTLLVGDLMLVVGNKDEEVDMSEYSKESGAGEEQQEPEAEESEGSAKAGAPEFSGQVVKLPQLGQTMEEGTIVSINIKENDEVNKGDVIFEVETDKATLEMESPAEGFVKGIVAEEGDTLLVGDPLLVLGEKDEVLPEGFIETLKKGEQPGAEEETETVEVKEEPVKQPEVKKQPKQPKKASGRIIASPRAKKAAKDLGVDLSAVAGTGPNGRIVEADVKKASEGGAAAKPAAGKKVKLGDVVERTRLQKITGEKMLESKRNIPCFYLNVEADVTDLVEFRSELNKAGDVKVSYNDFIMKALANGLEEFPLMAGQLDGDNIKVADSIGVGLAIGVGDDLVAPIVKGLENKDIKQVAKASREIIEKAKANKLSPDDLSGGSSTVSNLGAFGIDSFIPVVVPGQCSILGVGKITDTCVPSNGGIAIRKIMKMTLAVDHKIANGAYASQFLDHVKKQLQDPKNFE